MSTDYVIPAERLEALDKELLEIEREEIAAETQSTEPTDQGGANGNTDPPAGEANTADGDAPKPGEEGDGKPAPKPGQANAADDGAPTDNGTGDDPPTKGEPSSPEDAPIELEGEQFSRKDLAQIVKDQRNNKDWQKTNTEKATALADRAKGVDRVVDLLSKIAGDPETLEVVEDILGERIDPAILDQVRAAKETPPESVKPPESDPGGPSLQEQVNKLQFQLYLQKWTAGKGEEMNTDEKVDKFLAFATQNNEPDLEKAYILYTHDKAVEDKEAAEKRADELEQKAKEGGKPPQAPPAPVRPGAHQVKQEYRPSDDGSYDEAGERAMEVLNQ